MLTTNPSKFSPTGIAIVRKRAFSLILFQLLCLLAPHAAEAGQSLAGEWRFAPDPADLGIGQGWAAGKFDGTVHLPGSTAWRWHDVSFTGLRAEGGHKVSARRERNATTWFRITAGKDGVIRLRDNFVGRTPTWTPANLNVRKTGDTYEIALRRGDTVEGSLEVPTAEPSSPLDAAKPFAR